MMIIVIRKRLAISYHAVKCYSPGAAGLGNERFPSTAPALSSLSTAGVRKGDYGSLLSIESTFSKVTLCSPRDLPHHLIHQPRITETPTCYPH